MECTVEELDGSRVKVSAEVAAEAVDKAIAATYREFAGKYNFPGFRKGKAPRAVIDNALGKEAVLAAVTEDVINDAYPETVEELKLVPVGSPDFKDPGMVEPGKPFKFEYELQLRPKYELSSYDPVQIKLPSEEATPEEIDEQTKVLLEHYQGEELTDEFVKEKLGYDSVDALKEGVAEMIGSQKKAVIPRIKENASASELQERLVGDVPEAMAEQIEADLLQDFFTQLSRTGQTLDAYLAAEGIDNAQFKEDIKRQAEDEAKRELALDAWARNKGFEASEQDLLDEFANLGVEEPKELLEKWRKEGRLYLLREAVTRQKAMKDVLETAEVTIDNTLPEKDDK